MRYAVVVWVALLAGGCSALVSTSGLSGGSTADGGPLSEAGIPDAPPTDGSAADGAVRSTFLDSFTRNDGPIGNGWIEKTPGGAVIKDRKVLVIGGGPYRDNLVRRPASEDALDVEVSVTCALASFASSFPQVHARVQSATAGIANTLDSYVFYLNGGPNMVTLARTLGTADSVELASSILSSPLTANDRFRLRMRVTGVAPVRLEVSLDRFDGAGLTLLAHQIYLDSAPARIATPGSVGFSWNGVNALTYDDFQRDDLAGP